jgi:TetR/AcrR family transcriptional regulator, transcriptional repressor for nem operon
VKVSGKKAAENRAALVATARRLLNEHGFKGAGVTEISREAGLTQGGLYSQFKSKNALVAEAVRCSLADGARLVQQVLESGPQAVSAYLDAYVSENHVSDVSESCMVAACASEMWRQDEEIAAAFADGFRHMLELLQGAFPDTMQTETARRRAITLFAGMAGAVTLARAVQAADPALSREMIAAARQELEMLAG